LRLEPLAHSRHLTVDEWTQQVVGSMSVRSEAPPVTAPSLVVPVGAIALVILFVVLGAKLVRHSRLRAAGREWAARAQRIAEKARAADPVLAAPLEPVLAGTAGALRSGSIDPCTPAGRRVTEALVSLETRIDAQACRAHCERDEARADRILREIEAAVEGAEEASREASALRTG
jgi:hypothetical protein